MQLKKLKSMFKYILIYGKGQIDSPKDKMNFTTNTEYMGIVAYSIFSILVFTPMRVIMLLLKYKNCLAGIKSS